MINIQHIFYAVLLHFAVTFIVCFGAAYCFSKINKNNNNETTEEFELRKERETKFVNVLVNMFEIVTMCINSYLFNNMLIPIVIYRVIFHANFKSL